MKSTGMIREVDDIRRIIIPKDICDELDIYENDKMEFYIGLNGEIILKKFFLIDLQSEFMQDYSDALQSMMGNAIMIANRYEAIATTGIPKDQFISLPVFMKDAMRHKQTTEGRATLDIDLKGIAFPIVIEENAIGVIAFFVNAEDHINTYDRNLITFAINLLQKQLSNRKITIDS